MDLQLDAEVEQLKRLGQEAAAEAAPALETLVDYGDHGPGDEFSERGRRLALVLSSRLTRLVKGVARRRLLDVVRGLTTLPLARRGGRRVRRRPWEDNPTGVPR